MFLEKERKFSSVTELSNYFQLWTHGPTKGLIWGHTLGKLNCDVVFAVVLTVGLIKTLDTEQTDAVQLGLAVVEESKSDDVVRTVEVGMDWETKLTSTEATTLEVIDMNWMLLWPFESVKFSISKLRV